VQKITILLEELRALGHSGAAYDVWLIRAGKGGQFGSGFVTVNPNSKIAALADRVSLLFRHLRVIPVPCRTRYFCPLLGFGESEGSTDLPHR
jgi:hypothetical protein